MKKSIMKNIKSKISEEKGEFDIKAIAGTIAIIIIIGLIVLLLKNGFLQEIIDFFWDKIQTMIDEMTS